jgi:hypothetical protein
MNALIRLGTKGKGKTFFMPIIKLRMRGGPGDGPDDLPQPALDNNRFLHDSFADAQETRPAAQAVGCMPRAAGLKRPVMVVRGIHDQGKEKR